MIIETVSNSAHEIEIKFEDLEPGTVFEFASAGESGIGPRALKLIGEKYVLLTHIDEDDWFVLGDGSMVNRGITKVWGKLVGLKVQL